jgi:hypothetical protein
MDTFLRTNKLLVLAVETYQGSWTKGCELKVVEIPDDIKWSINGYDSIYGPEWIEEDHRRWY